MGLTTKEPIAISAYIPSGRYILQTDEDESTLTLKMSLEDGAHLHAHMRRLTGKVLHVAFVPEDELEAAPLQRGGWRRKRKGAKTAADSTD